MRLLVYIISLIWFFDSEAVNLMNADEEAAWREKITKVFDNTIWKFSNGKYKGELDRSKRSGLGAYRWNGEATYWGAWKDGNRNGVGIYICPEGFSLDDTHDCSFYVGSWVKEKRVGTGRCYDIYGELVYYGEFNDDKPVESQDVSMYYNYRFDCVEYSNDCQYIGETKDSKRHGYGIFIWPDGDAWFGFWDDDKQADNGIYLHYEGKAERGHWEGTEWIGNTKR